MQSSLSAHNVRVFVAETLYSKDRAFSVANSLWDSEGDLDDTRLWCSELGKSLLHGQFPDAEDHALGWRGSEALIAFHYNVPNNTLPIFWAKGEFRGKTWQPLLPRF